MAHAWVLSPGESRKHAKWSAFHFIDRINRFEYACEGTPKIFSN